MKAPLLLLLVPALATMAAARPVNHWTGSGSAERLSVCGIRGRTTEQIRRRLLARRGVEELGSSELFDDYVDKKARRWSFTRPAHRAHPAVVCRELVAGFRSLDFLISMACRSSQENCASLYRDLEALNERIKAMRPSGTDEP